MPFASELTGDQIADLRADVYYASINVAFCPNLTVFRCLTNQAIAQGTFAQFAWDNADVGAYTDVKENMVVYLSTTTNIRVPLWVGRVRKLPTADTFYINEASLVLQEDWVITVIDDRRLFEKLGRVAAGGAIYVDWDVPYAPPAPLIYNLQSGYVNPVASGSASFDFTPLANAIADGATITGWLWEVADGTITGGGTDTDQDITVSFPQGFRWVRLTVTSSNGQTNFMDFAVWVGTEYTIPNVIMPQITADMEAGYNATIQGYHTEATLVLRSLLDKTLVCLYSTELLSPTILTNVDMIGRFINEDGGGRGDEQYSDIQEVSFQIQGIGAQLAALSMSRFRLEDSTSPAVWGQVVKPTPTRMQAHMAARLNTLSNIVSVQVNPDNDVFISKSLQNEETSAGTGMLRQAQFINAKLNYAPTGELRIERDALYTPDAVLTTVMHFEWEMDDLIEFHIQRDYQETSGQVRSGAERYTRSLGVTKYLTASAPPTAQGEGEFAAAQDGLLLAEGSDDAASITELNELSGVFLAVSQPLVRMSVRYFDSWRNILIPTCFQWYTFDLPADSNPRGLIYTAGQRWLLVSIARDIDSDTGRNVTTGNFILEPVSGTAQVLGAVIPDAIEPALPSIPAIDAYAAFPPNPVINYPTDDPGELDLQPVNKLSGYQGYSPLPQDAAQEAANNAGNPGCQTFSVFFSNPSNVTGFVTTLGADYIVTAQGDAQIADDGWQHHNNLVSSDDGYTVVAPFGTHTPGTGFEPGDGSIPGPAYIRAAFITRTIPATTLTSVKVTFNLTKGSYSAVTPVVAIFLNGSLVASINPADITDGTAKTFAWSGMMAGVTSIGVQITTSYQLSAVYSGDCTITGMDTAGTGTDPFTGAPGTIVRGDAFYRGYNPEAGGLAQAYPAGGLYIQNAPLPIIPIFNPQHVYSFIFEGDGNPLLLRYADGEYSDNQNVPMQVQVCGPGAGNFRR